MKTKSKVPMKTKSKVPKGIKKELKLLNDSLLVKCDACHGTGNPYKTGNVKCTECDGTGIIGNVLKFIEKDMEEMKKEIAKIHTALYAYINRQSTEIRVKEVDGKWGDYSGTFTITDDDETTIVMNKAKEHFETYFKDGVWHHNKKLGLFITRGKVKTLVEEMKTSTK
jgi:predicted metal-dependent hydrolase